MSTDAEASSATFAQVVVHAALRERLTAVHELGACGPNGAESTNKWVGIVHLELMGFRQVNLRWGHGVGDQVLASVQRRLRASAPDGALLSDTGAAYTVLIESTSPQALRVGAEQLLNAARQPYRVGARDVRVDMRAGWACGPADTCGPELLEQAFLAFRAGRDTTGEAPTEYDEALSVDATVQQRVEAELHSALTDGGLRAHFQPIVDLRDGAVVGLEALIRWQHAVDGVRMPADFLPVAERAGMMPALGMWMLDQVLAELAVMRRQARGTPLRVWINLSAHELDGAAQLCRRIAAAIADGSVSPDEIGFEVTESTLLEDIDSAVDSLASLRRLGVGIALDDFGTGYSSLSYLRRLPVTAVKIDRSFVAGLGGSLADEAIVEAVIDLSHALGLRVTAEGVEDEVQAKALIALGADEAQGYFFSRPAPIEVIRPRTGMQWSGAPALETSSQAYDRRADRLPGFGSPRARLFLAALDNARDAIVVTTGAEVGPHGREIVYVNAAFESDTGFSAHEVVGRPVVSLAAQAPDEEFEAWSDRVVRSQQGASREVAWRRADGSSYVCEVTLSPIFDERHVLTHWLHVGRNLTERHVLAGERARFQWMVEQSSSLVFLFELDGRWTYANAAMRRAIGLDLDDPLDSVTNSSLFGDTHPFGGRSPGADATSHATPSDDWSGPYTFVHRSTGVPTEVVGDVQLLDDPLQPGRQFYAVVSRDVSEVNSLARSDQRRRALAGFVAAMAHRAVEDGVDDVLGDLNGLLAAFGRLIHCNVAFVDTIDRSTDVLRPSASWTTRAAGIGPDPRPVPLGEIARWLDVVAESRVVVDPELDRREHSWAGDLRGELPGRPIGSHVLARLLVGGELFGIFGVEDDDADRSWSDDEIDAIDRMANVLANLFHRQRSEAALRAEVLGAARRVAYDRVQLDIAEWALTLDANEPFDGIEQYLGRLGRVLLADSVTFSTLQGRRLRITARWPADSDMPPGSAPRLRYPALLAKLADLEPLCVDDVFQCDAAWAQQWRSDPRAPRSAIVIPLGSAGRWYGTLTVATSAEPRVWDEGQVSLIRYVSSTVAGVLARRRAEQSLHASDSRLRALVEASPDLIVVLDRAGAIQYANGAVRRLLGSTNDQIVGVSPLARVYHDDLDLAAQRLTGLLERRPIPITRVRIVRSDGTFGWWEMTSGVDHDNVDGSTILMGREVTAHVANELANTLRVDRLRYTFDLAQIALDVGPDEFLARLDTICAQIAAMLGADIVYVDQVDEARQELTPLGRIGDDKDVVVEQTSSVPFSMMPSWIARLRENEPVVVTMSEGRVEPWIEEKRRLFGVGGGQAAIALSAAGELVGVLGVSMISAERTWDDDEIAFLRIIAETISHVLDRARIDAALRASEARFRSLLETAADVVILVDDRDVIAYASPSSFDLLGHAPEDLIGRRASVLLADGGEDFVGLVGDPRSLPEAATAEINLRRADGSAIWVAHSTSRLVDPRGGRVTYRTSLSDITERKRLETELSWQALHDPLTGLGNRLLLQRRLETMGHSVGSHRGFAVMLIDLDHFKSINDTFGHAQGDAMLRIVARRLSALKRPSDTLARSGGDEFVVICPDTTLQAAEKIGRRIVATLDRPLTAGGVSVRLGASVGVAHRADGPFDEQDLLRDADQAMYRAKQAGGSQLRTASSRDRGSGLPGHESVGVVHGVDRLDGA